MSVREVRSENANSYTAVCAHGLAHMWSQHCQPSSVFDSSILKLRTGPGSFDLFKSILVLRSNSGIRVSHFQLLMLQSMQTDSVSTRYDYSYSVKVFLTACPKDTASFLTACRKEAESSFPFYRLPALTVLGAQLLQTSLPQAAAASGSFIRSCEHPPGPHHLAAVFVARATLRSTERSKRVRVGGRL